jgi:hypothetical protein
MNTNKLWTKFLMAGTLLALLFTAGCGLEYDIKGPAERALAEQTLTEQGSVVMTVLQGGDFQAVHEVLSSEAQQALDNATRMVGGWVDLEGLIMQQAPALAAWKFEDARVFTKNGTIRGNLDGRVEYVDGKSGKVQLELEQEEGTWKLRSFSLEQ